jgi:hypothetical protein
VLAATADRTEVPLLAPVHLSLDVYWRGERSVEFDPRVPDGCRGEIEPASTQAWGGGTWRHVGMLLHPARGPGELRIEPFTARSRDAEAKSQPIILQVTSVLAAAGQPHVKAMRELARLRSAPRRTTAEIDAFYVAVSAVLRGYLEERFGLRAPERTTEEFLQELEQSPALAGQRQELRAFLSQCDLVKFAAQVPGEPVHLETLATAERFVAATRADRVEVTA